MTHKKKIAVLLALLATLAGSANILTPTAFAAVEAPYSFNVKDYDNFYEPSGAKIQHDGHGNFNVPDASGYITSASGTTTVVTPPGEGYNYISGAGNTGGSATGTPGYDWSTDAYPSYPDMWQSTGGIINTGSYESTGYYSGGGAMAASDGSIGTVRFLGQSIRVYEGESLSNLLKGAGHFGGTSAWDGNVALAGHNRGPNAHFFYLKDLRVGDTITYTTLYGTRSYRVTRADKISVNDFTPLNGSYENRITLITCVANQPSLRLCVQADEI